MCDHALSVQYIGSDPEKARCREMRGYNSCEAVLLNIFAFYKVLSGCPEKLSTNFAGCYLE